jgi:hypothetical protein
MNHDEPSGQDLLPDELLWAEGGHASDIVLTTLADGQRAIVPLVVRTHVERCHACMTHLGHAALLSLHAGGRLLARAEHDRAVAQSLAPKPLPRLAIALGLAVAALGLVPMAFDGEGATFSFVTRDVPLFLRGLGTLFRHVEEPGSSVGLVVTYATATLLVCLGGAAVRFLPKKEVSR